VYTIEPFSNVLDAVKTMNDNRVGSLLVTENTKLVGMITERDVLKRIVEQKADPAKLAVKEIMSSPIVTLQQDASIEDAARLMAKKKVKRLPVVTKDGRILGIVSMTDLIRNQPALHALLVQSVKQEYDERQKLSVSIFLKESDRELYRQHAQKIETMQELLIFKKKRKITEEKLSFPDESTFVNEIKGLSNKLKVSIHNFTDDTIEVYGVNRAPAIQIRAKEGNTLTWYGVPMRLLLHPFIDSIITFSKKETILPEEIVHKIRGVKRAGHILVLAASTSPLCWHTISIVTKFAILNKNIKCDIVDVLQFRALIEKYDVLSVPKLIVNDEHELIATYSEPHLPEILLKHLS
jgi:sporulation protein YlmC with PRC-barrel domain